jgi:hypothetical protein
VVRHDLSGLRPVRRGHASHGHDSEQLSLV